MRVLGYHWKITITFSLSMVFLYFLFLDESPSDNYKYFMKYEKVSKQDWLNFQKMASVNINSEKPLNKLQKFISVLNEHGLEETKTVLTEDGPILTLDDKIDHLCSLNPILNIDFEFYDCLAEFLDAKKEIIRLLEPHQKLLNRLDNTYSIQSLKIDNQYLNANKLFSEVNAETYLYRAGQSFKINSELIVLNSLFKAIEKADSLEFCNRIIVSPINNQLLQLASINDFLTFVNILVEIDARLDVANYLVNYYPSMNNCLASISSKNLILFEGLSSTLTSELRRQLRNDSISIKQIDEEMEWHKKSIFKPQKTLNEMATRYMHLLNQSRSFQKVPYRNPKHIQDFKLDAGKHWNNSIGLIMLEIVPPKYIDFNSDIADLISKIHLVLANIDYKNCLHAKQKNCVTSFNDHLNPFSKQVPIFDKHENSLRYEHLLRNGKRKSVSISIK